MFVNPISNNEKDILMITFKKTVLMNDKKCFANFRQARDSKNISALHSLVSQTVWGGAVIPFFLCQYYQVLLLLFILNRPET